MDSLGAVSTPVMIAGAYGVRHWREIAHRNPFALRGHPLKLARCLDHVPSSFSFCRIALAAVDAEHLVAVGVPELTAAAFIVIAVNLGELPKASSGHIVIWGTFCARRHASDLVRSGYYALALLNETHWTRIATLMVEFAFSSRDLRAKG